MKIIKENIYLLLLVTICLSAVVLVNPRGNFPLNDDWVYAYSVKHLVDTGEMKLSEWAAPSIVSHVVWGYAWCKIGGEFSFETLRISAISFSLFGVVIFFLILNDIGFSKIKSFWGSALLFFNPLWFVTSFTFMTDVTYLTCVFMSVYFYKKGIDGLSSGPLYSTPYPLCFLIGSFFAGYAYLMRQLGIIIPLAVMLYLFVQKKLGWKKVFYVSVVALICVITHRYWLKNIHGYTWALLRGEDLKISFREFIPRIFGSAVYLGFFTLPFMISRFFEKNSSKRLNIFKQLILVSIAAIFIIYITGKGAIPYFDNVINRYGLGTITVHNYLSKNAGFLRYPFLWQVATFLGAGSIIYLFFNILKIDWYGRFIKGKIGLFVLVFGLQFLVSAIRYKYFDRYILMLVPLGIIIALSLIETDRIKTAGLAALIFIAGYSIIGSTDYMNWNRAKWRLGTALMEQGYKPSEIANGFDWDGWFTFEKNMETLRRTNRVETIGEWDWQSLNKYRVKISFQDYGDYAVKAGEAEYFSPLTFKKEKIYAWRID